MSSEIEVRKPTELSLSPDQTTFTPAQRTALEHIGVEHAAPGDLEVFFHVVKRTGLDPFARQIYMIGRQVSERQPNGEWRKVVKQTIQTGIDGYRLIGRRAANAAGATVAVHPVRWAHPAGGWREVWATEWGTPVAAQVTIERSGEPFTATALFDEYKQTKANGELTSMWKQRPAGQIAKCAEALAWRMAFPQDLSGIYVDEELQHADARPPAVREPATGTAKDAVRAAVAPAEQDQPPPEPTKLTKKQSARMHKAFNDAGYTQDQRDERIAYTCKVIGREIESSNELTAHEVGRVIDSLESGVNPGDEPPPADEPPPDIDGQVVGEGPTEDDELRDAILATAETKGRNLADVEAAFEHKHDGLSFYLGDHAQLEAFHSWVKHQRNA